MLAGGIVADTARVDTQGATGRHCTYEMVTLRDDDQLREIEDAWPGHDSRVEAPSVNDQVLRRQTCRNQVIARMAAGSSNSGAR